MDNIIVVPVYKKDIDKWEEISFRRCCEVLGQYKITLVTHIQCDCTIYDKIAAEYQVTLAKEYFSINYFENIAAYNRLMLSGEFYHRFLNYKYMLIYQLDAYVFADQLDYWCDKEYDYIGAPWFTDYLSVKDGGLLWKVGNGGLSLRKVSTMYRIFGNKGALLSFSQLWNLKNNIKSSWVRKLCTTIVRSLGYKNSIEFYKKDYPENEDVFICQYLEELGVQILIPEPEEAMFFAFENSPSYLFALTNGKLPFACHAWKRYEYDSFWVNYISDNYATKETNHI